jgi:hypothetical protein
VGVARDCGVEWSGVEWVGESLETREGAALLKKRASAFVENLPLANYPLCAYVGLCVSGYA